MRKSAGVFIGFIVCFMAGCNKAPTAAAEQDESLAIVVSANQLPTDGGVVTLNLQATTVAGAAGTGVVHLFSGFGAIDDGGETADITLVSGVATATYRCDPSTETRCNEEVDFVASWAGNLAKATLVPQTANIVIACQSTGACSCGQSAVGDRCATPDAWFTFEEGQGTVSADVTGNGHNGTLAANVGWAPGHTGGALSLPAGSDGFIAPNFSHLATLDSPFTVDAWIQPAANSGVLFHSADTPTGGSVHPYDWCVALLGFDTAGFLTVQNFWGHDEDKYTHATATMLLPLGQWSHVAASWSVANGLRLYINGVLVASNLPTDPTMLHRSSNPRPNPGPDYVILGSARLGTGYCWTDSVTLTPFAGQMDNARIWAEELTPVEIAALASY